MIKNSDCRDKLIFMVKIRGNMIVVLGRRSLKRSSTNVTVEFDHANCSWINGSIYLERVKNIF